MAKNSGGTLPDIFGPLNVPPQKGDKLVPVNDMAEVGDGLAKGREFPDPNRYVSEIE